MGSNGNNPLSIIMCSKSEWRQIVSRFDFSKVAVGFYFKGESMYHSKISTLISIIVLGICIYLPITISEGPFLNTLLFKNQSPMSIQLNNSISLNLTRGREWSANCKCVTLVDNVSQIQIIPLEYNSLTQLYSTLSGIPCHLQYNNQSTDIELIIKCSDCPISEHIPISVIVQNHYVDSNSNSIITQHKVIPLTFNSNYQSLHRIPIYYQQFKTYTNWFVGSFGFFSYYQQSTHIQRVQYTHYDPSSQSDHSLGLLFSHAGRILCVSKEYPSGLNYGLTVLALYGIIKLSLNILFLNSLSREELYYQLGKQYNNNNQILYFSSVFRAFLVCALPSLIVESGYFKEYFSEQLALIRMGKELLRMQKLLQFGKTIARLEGRQPVIKAEIEMNMSDKDIINDVQEFTQVNIRVEQSRKIQYSKKQMVEHSKMEKYADV